MKILIGENNLTEFKVLDDNDKDITDDLLVKSVQVSTEAHASSGNSITTVNIMLTRN